MDREAKLRRERERLHPAAAHAADSAGRPLREKPDHYRTIYERDRDRIIHSEAFRRLQYKTQVFVNHVGDQHRTRLTHSLEVAQVARSLAWSLDLNESFTEALALAHDLGHPPFGHAGERLLDSAMEDEGGFSHNRQALRVVDLLERRSPTYSGLNLSQELRQSLLKHEPVEGADGRGAAEQPLLEAQLVDLADSTAYHYHDVEDGICSGILDPDAMRTALPIWDEAVETARSKYPSDGLLLWRRSANELLGMAIADIHAESSARLATAAPESMVAAQRLEHACIGHSAAFRSAVAELHSYLYEHFYRSEEVSWHVQRATDLMGRVFAKLLEAPADVPGLFREQADTPRRAVCDYVASLTDRGVERVARQFSLM